MVVASRRGPFRPGTGGIPPYLAGREREQALFRDLLADLADRVPPAVEVVLHGPRGNGKTVLLRWLEREAAHHPPVEVVALTPAAAPDALRLAERLLPDSWWARLTPHEVSLAGFVWREASGTLRRSTASCVRAPGRTRWCCCWTRRTRWIGSLAEPC